MHRPTVAFLTVVMVLGAIALWIWPPNREQAALAGLQGALVRMSILLACLWLAEPQLRRFPPWMVLLFVVGGGLLLAGLKQPGFYRIALPVLFVLWLTRRTNPRPAAKPAP